MPYWKPLYIDDMVIDLSHLEPFEFEILPKNANQAASVRVIFNNHCFSEKFDPKAHVAPLPPTHISAFETRSFQRDRYELSKQLPALVRAFDGRRVAQTRSGTLVRVTLADGRDYAIVFTLKRMGSQACELFVLSAYPLDRRRSQIVATGEMKFNVAVALVLAGKKPKFPPGRF